MFWKIGSNGAGSRRLLHTERLPSGARMRHSAALLWGTWSSYPSYFLKTMVFYNLHLLQAASWKSCSYNLIDLAASHSGKKCLKVFGKDCWNWHWADHRDHGKDEHYTTSWEAQCSAWSKHSTYKSNCFGGKLCWEEYLVKNLKFLFL